MAFLKKFFIPDEDLNIPEIQEVTAGIEQRILLLITIRWVFIVILLLYSLLALIFYKINGIFSVVEENFLVPALCFFGIISYNAIYHLFYKWLFRLKIINNLQLVFDVFFVTVLVHYSGTTLSWMWAVYPLLVIEAAFLFRDDPKQTFNLAIFCILMYCLLTILEAYGILPSKSVPAIYQINQTRQYQVFFLSWFTFIIMSFTCISIYLTGIIHQEEEELKKQVIIDNLTGLYNRRYFFYRLVSEIERSRRFNHSASLLLIDLDGFKNINDTFGHLSGDLLLKKVADVFKTQIRRSHEQPSYDIDIPCRYGGDEFAIILPETDETEAQNAAERIRRTIFNECNLLVNSFNQGLTEHKQLAVSLSVGIATYPKHGIVKDELVKKADLALYRAKSQGKNQIVLCN
ncbi:MAG: GGDEF domain-containing protein [Candidatus Schekmanbacteria bacterium]|nr:GGDEF domain-containing protein [Candidatus Schekmanbacteria bacterium]